MRLLLGLLALLLLALAIPAIPADDPVVTTVDTGGPRIATTWVNSNPVAPSTTLVIGAQVIDDEGSWIRGVWADIQGVPVPVQLPPIDSAFDSANEVVEYVGVAPAVDGTYQIVIAAEDIWSNVGTPATITLVVQSVPPSPEGRMTGASVVPDAVTAGTPIVIHAILNLNATANIEYFVDVLGQDGTGTRQDSWGPTPNPGEYDFRALIDTGGLVRGDHTVYVHPNFGGTWGAYLTVPFFTGAPDMTLSVVSGPVSVTAKESLTVAVTIANAGCGPLCTATSVQVDVTATGGLVITADNAAALGATRWGSTSYGLPDLVDGSALLDLTLLVPADAPDGQALSVAVSLSYTSVTGAPFGPVHGEAAFEVRGTQMAVAVTASSTSAYPGDPVPLEVLLSGVGTYPVADVRVQVSVPPGLDRMGSNAADLGGLETSPGVFEFATLPPGDHLLRVDHQVSDGVADGDPLLLRAEVSFTSRYGPTETIVQTALVEALRPAFTVSLEGLPAEIEVGGRSAITVHVVNVGTAPAMAELRLDGAGRLRVGGSLLPFRIEGDVAVFDLGLVSPGERAFNVTVFSLAGDGEPGVLKANLSSSSPSGTPMGTAVTEATSVLVPTPTLPPPVVPPTTPPTTTDPSVPPAVPVAVVPVAFASLGVLGYALTDRGRAGLFLFLVPLYTRLRREQILDHETRGMIRGYVLANPGSHFNAIKDSLDLNNGTLAYHLNVLEKEGIIRSVKDGKFRRFFPSEMKIPNNGELPTKVQRLILEIVLETPAISQKEISRILGLSQSTVSYHLDRLKELSLVRAERQGMQLCYYVLPGGIEIISTTA